MHVELRDGYRMFVQEVGSGFPLIVLHGGPGMDHTTFRPWLAQRWDDPAFLAAFPWFNTQRYWQDRILELREQVALMDEPPLAV